MKHILETIRRRGRGEVSALPGKLKGLLFLGLLLLAGHALAGATYRMAGGTCTDSNHGEMFYPNDIDGGMYGPGPKLCADSVTAEVTMADGYIPGNWFESVNGQGAPLDIQAWSFTDGARSLSLSYPRNSTWEYIKGALPATTAPAVFDAVENYVFRTRLDGTWEFSLEFGARDGVCAIGSIAGPNNGIDGLCIPSSGHYYAIGTYEGWYRVPEPPSIGMAALALAILAGLRHRRRQGFGILSYAGGRMHPDSGTSGICFTGAA